MQINLDQKELFYTLENVQVDCSNETEERINDMFELVRNKGFQTRIDALRTEGYFVFFRKEITGDKFGLFEEVSEKTTITYEKFMELFGNKEKERISNLESFKPNGWYRSDYGTEYLIYAEEVDENNNIIKGYGFSDEGEWYVVKPGNSGLYRTVLATKEEVEERLKQEAIKRGFVVGAEIGCLSDTGYNCKISNNDYYLNIIGDDILWNEFAVDTSLIMEDGVWLEIENEKLPPHKEAPTLVGDSQVVVEHTKEFIPSKKQVLKYLLKKDIILTPKQYKKLWKK